MYYSTVSVVPSIEKNFKYYPDWNNESLQGSLRGAIAIPIYKIIQITSVLLVQLPLRELIKLAIGKKEGGQDG